jgi:hypothetical protein
LGRRDSVAGARPFTRRPPPPAPPAPQFGKWLNEESGILVSKASKAFVETNVGHMIRG